MAARGVITGAVVDGPFTPETALSVEAARDNGVKSEIAGQVDVLIAPGMEAAVMVLRTLTAITNGLAAGLVLGARGSHRGAGNARRLDGNADGLLRARIDRGRGSACRRASGLARRPSSSRPRRSPRRNPQKRICAAHRAAPSICASDRVTRIIGDTRSSADPACNTLVRRVFPFLAWRQRVTRDTLRADFGAGLISAVIVLPQAVAFATLAGMPPEYGLYGAMLPAIVGALWGSSWHLDVGTDQRHVSDGVRDHRRARGAVLRRLTSRWC